MLSDSARFNSKQGKGSFCLGVMNVAFTPVNTITSKAEQLYEKAKSTISQLDKSSTPPGLLEQYEIQLERLQPSKNQAGPGCEFMMTPGMIVAPGEYCLSLALMRFKWLLITPRSSNALRQKVSWHCRRIESSFLQRHDCKRHIATQALRSPNTFSSTSAQPTPTWLLRSILTSLSTVLVSLCR